MTISLPQVPYDLQRDALYRPDELFDCFDPSDATSFERCYDTRVFHHVTETGKLAPDANELAARTLHDFHVRQALRTFLSSYEQRQVVGIMGGHGLSRTSEAYRQCVCVSKRLTEMGYLMMSGGGPGAMEATHLGAWLAGRTDSEVEEALQILSASPTFNDAGWQADAVRVCRRFPQDNHYKSLSIPTWLYGHEPPTVFATHIAKLFENSIREDTLLTEAYGGLIFVEGSAGTLQEIFQEAVQNHYLSLGYPSPMIFVGRKFWGEEVPVYPFFEHMIRTGRYRNLLLALVDTADEIIAAVTQP